MLTNKIVNQHFLCVYTKKSSKRTPLFYIWGYTKKRVLCELFSIYGDIQKKRVLCELFFCFKLNYKKRVLKRTLFFVIPADVEHIMQQNVIVFYFRHLSEFFLM